jgi:hypothetical protein
MRFMNPQNCQIYSRTTKNHETSRNCTKRTQKPSSFDLVPPCCMINAIFLKNSQNGPQIMIFTPYCIVECTCKFATLQRQQRDQNQAPKQEKHSFPTTTGQIYRSIHSGNRSAIHAAVNTKKTRCIVHPKFFWWIGLRFRRPTPGSKFLASLNSRECLALSNCTMTRDRCAHWPITPSVDFP